MVSRDDGEHDFRRHQSILAFPLNHYFMILYLLLRRLFYYSRIIIMAILSQIEKVYPIFYQASRTFIRSLREEEEVEDLYRLLWKRF